MRRVIPVRLAAMVAAAAVLAGAPAPAADTQRSDAIFARLDTNGDGKVTPEELDLEKIGVFGWLDTNQDNMIEPNEVKLSPEQFRAIDTNGDGRISGIEFIDSDLDDFAHFDTNNDGVITREELRQGLP